MCYRDRLQHLNAASPLSLYVHHMSLGNFTFTPSAINKDPVDNEGHAHLYINGEKITRVYGNWVHIPSSLLVTGPNAVSVTLNGNDHSEWARDGKSISSTVIVIKPDTNAAGSNE